MAFIEFIDLLFEPKLEERKLQIKEKSEHNENSLSTLGIFPDPEKASRLETKINGTKRKED